MLKALALVVFPLVATDSAAAATFLVDSSVTRDAASRTALFEIEFSEAPDLFTGDEFNRTKDAFQFYIDPDDGPNPGASFSVLIRGEEIKYGGDLRVRDRFPDSIDPEASGWGPLRGTVGYQQAGPLVSFNVPFDLLGAEDGFFSYQLLTTHYGDLTGVREGSTAAPVPVPPAIALLAAAMAGLSAVGLRSGRRRRVAA